MPFISVTRLRVRSWLYMPAFFLDAFRTSSQAKSSEGVLAVRVLRDAHKTFWTLTSWDSEAAMRKFMLAKPHRPAMLKLRTWCDEASIVHWNQPTADMPTWPEAHRRMQLEGRLSKVDHPTPAQTARQIAAPVVRPTSEVIFK